MPNQSEPRKIREYSVAEDKPVKVYDFDASGVESDISHKYTFEKSETFAFSLAVLTVLEAADGTRSWTLRINGNSDDASLGALTLFNLMREDKVLKSGEIGNAEVTDYAGNPRGF